MGMALPGSLAEPLSWTGEGWPAADETTLEADAQKFKALADFLDEQAKKLDVALAVVRQGNDGPAIDAFTQWWRHNDRPPALLRDDAKAARVLAAAFANFAALTLARKFYFVVRLMVLKWYVEQLERLPGWLGNWLIDRAKAGAGRDLEDHTRKVVDTVDEQLAETFAKARELMRVLGEWKKQLESAQRQREMAELQGDLAAINPHYNDPNQLYNYNCVHCGIAYDLRRRGLDIEATALPEDMLEDGGRDLSGPIRELYGRDLQKGSREDIEEYFRNAGPGSRGIIQVDWPSGGGHVFNVENVNGEVVFVDAQNNRVDASDIFARSEDPDFVRTDDVDLPSSSDSDEFAKD